MNPYVIAVTTLPEFRLEVIFTSGDRRIFDVKPYLGRGVFRQLQDPVVFRTAHVVAGSVEWTGENPLSSPAFSFDTLYVDGVPSDVVARS